MTDRHVSRLWEGVESRAGAILVVAVFCGLLLSGCGDIGETLADLFRIGGNGNADAQPPEGERLVETFFQVTRVELRADAAPTIEAFGGDATQYTLTSDAALEFDVAGAEGETRGLESGDVVIERPVAGALTVIQRD